MKNKSKFIFALYIFIYLILITISFNEINKTFKDINYIERYDDYCENIQDSKEKCNLNRDDLKSSADKLTIFYNIMQSEIFYDLPIIAPIILTIFSMYYINILFKSKYLYYYIQRKKYKSFVIKMILNAYKYALVAPIFIGIIYLLSSSISEHNSTILVSLFQTSSFDIIHHNTKNFVLLYAINITLNWLFIINIALIIQSKNRKYIFNIIEFIIIYFILEIILENLPFNYWLFGIYGLSTMSIYSHLTASIIYFIVSFIAMISVYKNKEKILKKIGV